MSCLRCWQHWLQLHQVCGILWHVSFGVSPWRKAEFIRLLLSQAEFCIIFSLLLSLLLLSLKVIFSFIFPASFFSAVTDLEVVAVASDTRLAHLDAWQLMAAASLWSSVFIKCPFWGASTSRWGPGDLPETGGSEPKKNVHGFHMIYGYVWWF